MPSNSLLRSLFHPTGTPKIVPTAEWYDNVNFTVSIENMGTSTANDTSTEWTVHPATNLTSGKIIYGEQPRSVIHPFQKGFITGFGMHEEHRYQQIVVNFITYMRDNEPQCHQIDAREMRPAGYNRLRYTPFRVMPLPLERYREWT